MDNFDLRKYLAEGKLLKEAPKPYTDETRKGEVGNLADDIELEGDARQKFISDLMKATKDGSWDTFYDIADKIMSKYLAEGKLLKEAQEIDMAKSFLENKGLKVEAVKSGNEGNDKAGKEGEAFIWDGGEGDMNYKSDGKEAFYVYMPFDEEIMKEMKSKFPVIKTGGKSGKYYEVVIEKK